MSTVISFADLSDLDRSDDIIGEHRAAMMDGWPGTYVVATANSNYTVQAHGVNDEGYLTATVHCPAHSLTGAPAAILFDVVYRILDDRLVVVDNEDVRRVLFRSSSIRDVFHVASF